MENLNLPNQQRKLFNGISNFTIKEKPFFERMQILKCRTWNVWMLITEKIIWISLLDRNTTSFSSVYWTNFGRLTSLNQLLIKFECKLFSRSKASQGIQQDATLSAKKYLNLEHFTSSRDIEKIIICREDENQQDRLNCLTRNFLLKTYRSVPEV